jgi:hypothetical protein
MTGWTEADMLAAARRLGLVLAPHQMPGVLASLAVASGAAASLTQVALAPTDEPAPVFTPR